MGFSEILGYFRKRKLFLGISLLMQEIINSLMVSATLANPHSTYDYSIRRREETRCISYTYSKVMCTHACHVK